MQKRTFLLSSLAFGAMLLTGCAMPEPLMNPGAGNVPKGFTRQEVHAAILKAAEMRRWRFVDEANGVVRLAYPNGPRTQNYEVIVRVDYDDTSYRVAYESSYGLDEGPCVRPADEGKQCLHRNVNKWLRNLRNDIARVMESKVIEKRK